MKATPDTQIDTSVVAIVDDDEAVREGLALLLRTVGLQTRCYPDANSFLADAGDSALGCALFDIRMPRMDGLSLVRELRTRADARDLPVVVMSAYNDSLQEREVIEAGADGFLPKPFTIAQLRSTIDKAISHRQA